MGIAPKKDERDAVWEEILPALIAFSHFLLKTKKWFRGDKADSYVQGKEAFDYAMEAVEKYLTEPQKYDPDKGTLSNYLKYNIIRSLISNDCRLKENSLLVDPNAKLDDSDASYTDLFQPHFEEYFDEQIDYDRVMQYVAEEVKGDNIAEEVLLGISYGLLRRDTIAEFEMSAKEYDNAIRRLETAFEHAAKRFNLRPSKL